MSSFKRSLSYMAVFCSIIVTILVSTVYYHRSLDGTLSAIPYGLYYKHLHLSIRPPQRNYSILTGALPNFANETMYMNDGYQVNVPNGWGYIFNLVISTAAWRQLKFHTIVAITVDYKKASPASLRVMKYVDNKLRSLNATVIYFDVPSNMKVRISQTLRIAVGQLDFVNDADVLFTDDSDMWPIRATRYAIPAGKSIYVANALCCGRFEHFNKYGVYTSYREYPMSSVGMSGRTWRTVYGKLIDGYPDRKTNIYRLENVKPLIKRIEDFAKEAKIKNLYSSNHGGHGWHLDQQIASYGIGEYVYENGHKHLAYQTNRTCIIVHGWKQYWENRKKCIETVHFGAYRTWIGSTWKQVRVIFGHFYGPNSTIVKFLEEYRNGFVNQAGRLF